MLLGYLGKTFAKTTGNVWLKSDLKVLNTFLQHKDTHRYPRGTKNGRTGSIINLMISRQSTSATIEDVRVYRDTYCELDQNFIKTKIG